MPDLEHNGNNLYEEAKSWLDEIEGNREGISETEREFFSMVIAFVISGWMERFTSEGIVNLSLLKEYIEKEKERAIQLIIVTFDLLVGVINGVKPEEKIKKEMEERLKTLALNRKKQ
jgi:hypothetical protein